MPRIKRVSRTTDYILRELARDAVEDNKACSVVALSIAAACPYEEAFKVLEAAGRKKGNGVTYEIIFKALEALGFRFMSIPPESFIEKYPKAHRVLKSVTTHHPDRFPSVWDDGNTYLLFTADHVLAVKGGENHDHTRGRAIRVKRIYRVMKK